MTDISRRVFFVSAAASGSAALLAVPPTLASVAPGENSVEVIYGNWTIRDYDRLGHLSVLAAHDADGRVRTFNRVPSRFARVPYEYNLSHKERHVRSRERCYLIGSEPFDAKHDAWKITAVVNIRGERRLVDAELMRKEPRKRPPTPPEELPTAKRAKYYEDLIRSDITTGKKVGGYYHNQELTTLIVSVLG